MHKAKVVDTEFLNISKKLILVAHGILRNKLNKLGLNETSLKRIHR